jgi:hypothetical protein
VNRRKTPLEILSDYQKNVERWKASGAHYADIQPLQSKDIIIIKQFLHPTNKRESKDMTKLLINFLCDEGITTAQDIYEKLQCSDKPILTRLKIMKQFGLIRREAKKYYIATPRLVEIQRKYLRHLCG